MYSRDFCYWLQGYFEIAKGNNSEGLTVHQVEIVQKHLALVFKHEIDPSYGDKKHQADLNKIHNQNILDNNPHSLPYGTDPVIRC